MGGGATKWEGGGQNGRGGEGDGKSFSHAEGGHKKFCGSFYTVVLPILKGGCEMFTLFERGGGCAKGFTLS